MREIGVKQEEVEEQKKEIAESNLQNTVEQSEEFGVKQEEIKEQKKEIAESNLQNTAEQAEELGVKQDEIEEQKKDIAESNLQNTAATIKLGGKNLPRTLRSLSATTEEVLQELPHLYS